MQYLEQPSETGSSAYLRQPMHIAKPQATNPLSHRHHPSANATNRPIIPSSPNHHLHHPSAHLMHNFHGSPGVPTASPHRAHPHSSLHHSSAYPPSSSQRSAPIYPNDPISIQDYLHKRVTEFVRSSSKYYALLHSQTDGEKENDFLSFATLLISKASFFTDHHCSVIVHGVPFSFLFRTSQCDPFEDASKLFALIKNTEECVEKSV
jgi:hypothetical protein